MNIQIKSLKECRERLEELGPRVHYVNVKFDFDLSIVGFQGEVQDSVLLEPSVWICVDDLEQKLNRRLA